MRKVYAKYAEDAAKDPMAALQGSNGESEYSDPFTDRFPWFRLIGRGLVFLGNLLVPCPVTQCICIVNEKGDVMGYLRVAVEPVGDAEDETEVDHLSGSSRGITRSSTMRQLARIDFCDNDPQLKTILERQRQLKEAEELVPKDTSDNGDEVQVTDSSSTEECCPPPPAHLQDDQEFIFRVSILQLTGLSKDYADVFAQFNFRHRHDEAFSTESIKNCSRSRVPSGFYRDQNIVVKVTKSFREYLATQPLVFELYGHYQQHPLHREAAVEVGLQLLKGSNSAQNGQTR